MSYLKKVSLHDGQIGQVEVSMMERILLQLKTVPHLRVVPALTTAWVTLITYPFIKGVCLLVGVY